MKFGTLYSGIGGADAGFCAAGWKCVFQAEADPFRRSVLTRRWPDVDVFHDVKKTRPLGPSPDVVYAEFPDTNFDKWWQPAFFVAHGAVFGGLKFFVIECSPSVSPSGILRDLALAAWWFRIVQVGIRIATPSIPREAQHVRQRLYIIASPDRDRVDGLKLGGFSVDMEVDVGPVPHARGTFEYFECSMGLKTGWSCACATTPCRCDPEKRAQALRDATPPHLTLWLAQTLDGRWSNEEKR